MATLTRGLAVLVALGVGAAAPAAAHAVSCPSVPVAQTFAQWLDPAYYMSAPNGGFEAGGTSWTLAGGAATVQDNEPWHVGSATDHVALALPTGASARSAAVCIDVDHPTVRLFVRNTGAVAARLAVSVEYTGLDGKPASLSIGQLVGGAAWAPTPPIPVVVNLLSLLGDQHVAFRFAPADTLGQWRIDDVYVDPFGKR